MALAPTFRDETPGSRGTADFSVEPLCIWRAPFTTCTLLDIAPASGAYPLAISPDGSTIYGSAQIGSVWRPVRWNTTTLAMTALDNSLLPGNAAAVAASDDGSIIFGGGTGGARPINASRISSPLVRWTAGGAASSLVPDPSSGDIGVVFGTDLQAPFGMCSADGSVMIADVGAGGLPPYKWVNNAAVLLPGTTSFMRTQAAAPSGGAVFGITGDKPARWTGTTLQMLADPAGSTASMYGANSDTSAVWGLLATNIVAFWSTPLSGAGVLHNMATLPSWDGTFSRPHVGWVAHDAGSTVAVGGSPFGTYGDTVNPWGEQAVKWTGTTVTPLGYLAHTDPYRVWSSAFGCNHDGSIVCGTNDLFYCEPVWWDASNTIHRLPTLCDRDPDRSWFGEALGISRDGSVIFGRTGIFVPTDIALTTSELLFQPEGVFVDLANEANRRQLIASGGTPAWMGANGSIPLGAVPAVYLTTEGPPRDFAQNNGHGGAFAITDPLDASSGPGCTPYTVTESAGSAANPEWRLSVSDDGGKTWSRLLKPRAIGTMGDYAKRLRWLKMGQARHRVVKLECTDPVRRNIIGIYIDTDQGMG